MSKPATDKKKPDPSDPKEMRKHRRFDVTTHKLNATIAVLKSNKVTGCLVPLKDFSKSGAGVYIKFEVEKDSVVKLSLEGLPYDPLDARVVWCGSSAGDPQAPPTHPFRLGLEFAPSDDLARDNQSAIYNHLNRMLAETLSS